MPDHATSSDPAVQAQLNRFAQLSPGRDVLGLDRITALFDVLGRPQDRLPPVFHVAGTNGKGSTCAFLRAILEAAGRRVHVYTSPHLVRFNERIRLAGTLIEDADLAPLLAEVLDAAEADGIGPSFFEATTAAAFLAFSRVPADACVIEVGLGGRLDATNVVAPVVCGIAQVGIDHQAFLGDTLAQIAGEKAGIAKRGVPLVCLAQESEALSAIESVAAAAGAPLCLEGREWVLDESLQPALAGAHQIRNANLAVQMFGHARHPRESGDPASSRLPNQKLDSRFRGNDGVRMAIATATWPGRLQRLADGPLTTGKRIWIDGAHNAAAAHALAVELAHEPKHLILGMLANKDAEAIVAALAPHALSLTFVEVPGHASHDASMLAQQWSGKAAGNLRYALKTLNGDVLVAGSLYLAGVALTLNEQIPD